MDRVRVLSRYRIRIAAWYGNAVKGVLVLRSAKNTGVLSPLSIVIWALDGFSTVLVRLALGVLQFAALLVIGPLGYSKETVLGFMLLWQGVGYTVSMVWGLVGLPVLNIGTIKTLRHMNE